jgi:hypothetical protein
LAAVIESLSQGKISGKDLAQQSAESLIELLLTYIRGIHVLFVALRRNLTGCRQTCISWK